MNHNQQQQSANSKKSVNNSKKLLKKAFSEFNTGHTEKALGFAIESIALNKKNHQCQHLIANIYTEKGEYFKAIDHLKLAIKYDPYNVEQHYNLAINLKKIGKIEESLERQKMAIKIDPDNVSCLNEVGV